MTELFDSSADPESQRVGPSLTRALELSAERMERVIAEVDPTHIVATVSGGRDSAAEVELALELGIKIDLILHCRTGTGIPQTTKHVVDYYGSLGPNFVMADAGDAVRRTETRRRLGCLKHRQARSEGCAQPLVQSSSRKIRYDDRSWAFGFAVGLLSRAGALFHGLRRSGEYP